MHLPSSTRKIYMILWKYVHFDAALNLAWLALGAAALGSAIFDSRDFRSSSASRIITALVFAGLLFPCISASDDLVWMEAVPVPPEHGREHSDTSTASASSGLITLLQAHDSQITGGAIRLTCNFIFLGLVIAPVSFSVSRASSPGVGRSPPAVYPL